jgi:hypothetical protein
MARHVVKPGARVRLAEWLPTSPVGMSPTRDWLATTRRETDRLIQQGPRPASCAGRGAFHTMNGMGSPILMRYSSW